MANTLIKVIWVNERIYKDLNMVNPAKLKH